MSRCASGLDRLLGEERALLRGRRVGLICNPTAIDGEYRHAADRLHADPDVTLVRLFGPEHGVRGDAQDMIAVGGAEAARDPITGLDAVSLYGATEESLRPPEGSLDGIDVLVFDIQDVGSRYYTYVYTLAGCMEAAARQGVAVVVCDRPNPLGGVAVEGPILRPGLESFVGRFPVPVRHGCTAGELALLWRDQLGLDLDLRVVPVGGWTRSQDYASTGLPWVMPSPNMPTVDTARVYPGMCLVEGTQLSEGRGTTRPFELAGAPFVDAHRLAVELERRVARADSAGVRFRPVVFRPTFHKHAGRPCGGVQVHAVDPQAFEPFLVGIAFVQACRDLWPDDFAWRTEAYEFVSDRLAIDLLLGHPGLRPMIEEGAPLADIRATWSTDLEAWRATRAPHLLYPDE